MRFTVISSDYEPAVPRQEVCRSINSIASQTFTDFEWIIAHDGPKKVPYHEEYDLSVLREKPIVIQTNERMGHWGTYGYEYAMKHVAKGEFFLCLNSNNILHPNALERIDRCLKETSRQIVIFAIINGNVPYFPGDPENVTDLMQLCAHRSIWKEVGYFFDKSNILDRVIYGRMCSLHPYARIESVLGQNF